MICRLLKSSIVAWCVCCSVLFASGQCPDSAELNITATLYSQENGLPSNMLIEIAKDSTGYMYFLGVDGNWIRYDGVNFSVNNRNDSIPFEHFGFMGGAADSYRQQYINKVHYKYQENKNGTAYRWGLTNDSLFWIDLSKNKREAFLLPKEIRADQPTNMFPNGDVCWITTAEKVFCFDLNSKKILNAAMPPLAEIETPGRQPLFMFFLPDGSSYLIFQNMILKQDHQSTIFKKLCTLSPHPFRAILPEIIMDHYLFVTESNKLHEVNLENGSLRTIDMAEYTGIKNASALRITTLRNYHNYLFIGTSNAGLFIFNRCTNSMQHFDYEKQNATDLTNSVIWLAFLDENVVWMQTDAGLIKLEINDQKIKTYMPSSIRKGGVCNDCNNVRAVYNLDNNNLLAATLAGVYNFNLTSGQFSTVASPVDNTPVWNNRPVSAITSDGNGSIFIADWHNEGILLLNRKKKQLANILPEKDHPGFSFNYMRCLLYDSHHTLWAGTSEGLVRITGLDEFQRNGFKGKLNVTDNIHGQRFSDCFAITADSKDNIWIGTLKGLFIYNYKTDSLIKYIHEGDNNKTISDNEVRSIVISNDRDAWIGTNHGGLNHFDIFSKTFTSFTTENGLPNNSIYTILEDQKGFLWLGTNGGLCRFHKADHSVRNYTPRDGIQNFEFNTNAICTTDDRRFCFGGRTGFNIFYPDSLGVGFAPSQAVITKFKIFDKEYAVTDSVIHLAHDMNSLAFDFAALNYYRSNDNQYTYMLEGADKDWIKSGNRGYTSYPNLQPGHYTFKVRAANHTGVWGEGVTSMSFVINPAWYNTWWFRAILMFIISAVIYGIYRYRLSQMLKLHAVRDRIASDLHDEIGSTLSSISLSSTIIQSKLNGSNTEVKKLLQQVSSNTDNMMEALSDIVWAINTRNDRFDNVVNRMRAFAIEILEPGNINVQFHVSDDIHDVHLGMQQRKNLYLIFKEAVNNAAKYADCKNVIVDISRQGSKTFVLKIRDDGKGFDASPLTPLQRRGEFGGNGIRNMKKRAEELGGEISIESSPGKGTGLNLKFNV